LQDQSQTIVVQNASPVSFNLSFCDTIIKSSVQRTKELARAVLSHKGEHQIHCTNHQTELLHSISSATQPKGG
jgi:hypothetical protein